jgi:hypothetical protein
VKAATRKDGSMTRMVIVVAAIVAFGLVALILIPNYRSNDVAWCIANLKQIEAATALWAQEHKAGTNAIPKDSDLFGPGKYVDKKPQCPIGGSYTVGKISERPRCSVPNHRLE